LAQRLHEARNAGEALLLVIPIAQIDEPLIGAQPQRPGVLLDQLDEPRRIGEPIAAQCDDSAFGPGLDPLDTSLAAISLDPDDLQYVLDLGGQRTEAVDQLGSKGVALAPARQLRE